MLGNPKQRAARRGRDRCPSRSEAIRGREPSGRALADRPKFFAQLLPRILEVKARTGRPHWLVIDEAHHLLPTGPDAASLTSQLPDRGTLFITVHPGAVEPSALANVRTLLAIGEHPEQTIQDFCSATGERNRRARRSRTTGLAAGDAMLWWRGERPHAHSHRSRREPNANGIRGNTPRGTSEPSAASTSAGLSESSTSRLPTCTNFSSSPTASMRRPGSSTASRATTRSGCAPQVKDNPLADEIARIEADRRASTRDARAAIRAAVEGGYTLPADGSSRGNG